MMSASAGYLGFRENAGEGSEIDALRFVVQQVLAEVATSTVVKVVGARSNGEVAPPGTVDVQILVHQIDGTGAAHPHGTIYNVPYKRNQCGPHGIIMDPKAGDVGVIVCASRDISAVKANQGDASPPGSLRRHDLADALYVGTVIAKGAPQNYVQFTDDGMNLVTLGTISITATTIHLNGNVVQQGGTVTSNGKHIDNTHVHGEVMSGSSNTTPPVV
jgi:Phage protein Gp138 N-terminal domain